MIPKTVLTMMAWRRRSQLILFLKAALGTGASAGADLAPDSYREAAKPGSSSSDRAAAGGRGRAKAHRARDRARTASDGELASRRRTRIAAGAAKL